MITSDGISNQRGITLPWAELQAVNAYKMDAMTKVLTYLEFEHESGEFLEFMNEDSEFAELLASLDQFLDLPNGWKLQIEQATVDDEPVVLWSKKNE